MHLSFYGRTHFSDLLIGNNCRAHGASVQPSSYLRMLKADHPKAGVKATSDFKRIDRKTASEIDKELKKKSGL